MEKENEKNNSRRDFFKATALAVCGAAIASVIKPVKLMADAGKDTAAAGSKAPLKIPDPNIQYAFAIDIDKCIGCGNCAKACKLENDVPQEPFFFRTWVEEYAIKNDGTVKIESPNGAIDGLKQSVPKEDIDRSFFVPKLCNHCVKSPCEQVCPVGATYRSPDGVVLIDKEYCIGCGYCVQACPYGCRYISPVTHTADKCTMCYHRLKKGMEPACVEACPTGARMHGNLRDKDSEIVKFIKDNDTRVLKPHMNTQPRVFYKSLNEKVS